MPSLPKTSAAGTAFLLFFSRLLFLLLLGSLSARGASLREHRLRGSEPDPHSGAPYQSPNVDMLKALEYIENLRQRSGTDSQQQALLAPELHDNDMDTAEKLRAMLRLASPTKSQGQAGQDENEEEEEEKEEDGEGEEEDKTQEWLQAVLSALQQTEKASKRIAVRPNAALGKGQRSAATDEEDGTSPWAKQRHGARSHRNHPLMFEEDEEGEGEEEEEGRASDRDSPFKRTNENVEEKYTPQNLATLQSVFEELGRLANTKAGHKRQIEGDEDEDDNDGDGDDDNYMFNVRNLAYEDVAGGEEWAPLEEQEQEEEEEEEERNNREEFDRGLDYGNDEEEGDDEEDEDTYPVKRSSQSGPGDDPDDITKLVDYYLLKVLEKTEEEEHKRELEEEEEERAERRVAQSQYRDQIDTQAIYQLLQISQKLQIPPEDLLGLLKTEEMTKQDRSLVGSRAQPRRPNELSRVKDKLSQISSHKENKSPPSKLYNRRLPDTQSSIPEDVNTEEILNILGLGSVGNQNATPFKTKKLHESSQSRFYTAPARQGGYTLPQMRTPDKLKDYDDTVDEDELAAYLAAQMLAQYPKTVDQYNNKAGPKRASEPASREEDEQLGSFEQVIQDLFDRMDSDKSPPQKRQSETKAMGGAPQKQRLDDEALMKILSYLNPENEESEDEDADNKTAKGM